MASQMDKLPEDLLKKLQGMADKTNSQTSASSGGEAKTNKPAQATETPAKERQAK